MKKAELEAALKAAEEEIAHLRRVVKRDIAYLEEFHVEQGTCILQFKSWVAPELARICLGAVDESGGPNYLSQILEASMALDATLNSERGILRIYVDVVKPGGMTPHEARVKAEAERDEALAKLAAMDAR